jgi:hypothetical protein
MTKLTVSSGGSKIDNRMKKLLTIFLCVFFSYLYSQKNESDKVVSLMKLQEEAWNKGDIEGFMKYYWKSDSLKFIGRSGITYGWQKTLDNYKKSYPDKAAMGQLVFEINTKEQLSKEAIYIIGKWSLIKDKPAGGYFTLLWKKIKGEWVIVADHTS